MSQPVTQAMRDALKWLQKRGGDGAVVRATSDNPESRGAKYTTLLAQGELAPHFWATYTRLIKAGLVVEYQLGGGRRIRVARAA